jgi:hypothetical protein
MGTNEILVPTEPPSRQLIVPVPVINRRGQISGVGGMSSSSSSVTFDSFDKIVSQKGSGLNLILGVLVIVVKDEN